MLQFKDIQKRLKEVPEPIEVTQARQLIKNAFRRLEFVEEGHKYYVHQDDGTTITLPSVSGVCHQFSPECDWDEITMRYAMKHGMTVDEVKKNWHITNILSTTRGTQTHWFGENYMNFFLGNEQMVKDNFSAQYEDGYFLPYCGKEEAIVKYYEDIYALDSVFPVMPEAIVYTGLNDTLNLQQNYAGTFDILLAMRDSSGKIRFIIEDWKTNKDIFKERARKFGNMLLPPFDNLYDEPYSTYTIQLNCYQLALEQIGIKVADRRIVWLKDDGTYEKIRVNNLTETLKTIL